MAFLREPTLWDGVFLTRHHLSLALKNATFKIKDDDDDIWYP
jgi:hypothetical protein